MKQKSNKAKHYILGTLVGVFVLRMFKLAYQRSRLENLLDRVVGKDIQTVEVSQELVDKLPKTSFDFRGRPTEPLNFILVGNAAQIEQAFARAGWQKAVPINASNWARAFWAGLFDKPYPTGPMTPYYIYTTPQDLAFQKETDRRSFRARHHVRFWRTNLELANGVKLWLGMASFDKSLRLINGLRFPYHHIDADLDGEREFIVKDLTGQGAKESGRFNLGGKKQGRNDHGDSYFSDGQIVALEFAGVKIEA